MSLKITKVVSLVIPLCVVMLLPASAQIKVTYRAWTSARGDTVNAVMLSCSNSVVMLRKVDGKVLKIKSTDLSAADQAYLVGLQEESAVSAETQASPGANTQSASDFLAEEAGSPVATNIAGAQWFIGKAVVCSNFDGHYISNIYTQKFDTFYCYRKMPPGYRLIIVKCVITALASDPEAVNKLNKLRAPLAEKLPIIGNNLLISDGQNKDLGGKYRLMNATNITLRCDAPRKRYTTQWLVLPPAKGGAYFLENGSEKPFFGGQASKPPWFKTCSVQNGFTGLLEVGKPASVALFYGIPVDMDPGMLRIEIEGQSGMLLSVETGR
ncbi:MAG: hypothetical protein WCN95_03525 [bacterium]